MFEQARLLAAQIPDSLYKFALYSRVGIDALSRGDAQAAPRNFLLALDMAERFGTASHRVNSLSNLASSQHDLGNDEDAIPLLSEALDIIGNDRVNHLQTAGLGQPGDVLPVRRQAGAGAGAGRAVSMRRRSPAWR
jgi:two-component system cell cycle response regulator